MRNLATFNPAVDLNHTVYVPQGHYDGFLFCISGTTAAAAALLTTDNIGQLIFQMRGQQIIQSSATGIFHMNTRLFGAPHSVTPVAGATQIAFYVPASPDPKKLPNSFFVERDGNLSIQFNTGADLVTDLTVSPLLQVFGVPSLTPALFVPIITENVEALVTGSNPLNVPSIPNVTDIFMRPATPANVNRISIRRGSGTLQEVWEASYFAYAALGNILDQVELGEVLGVDDTAALTPNNLHVVPGHNRSLVSMASGALQIDVLCTAATGFTTMYMAAQHLGDMAKKSREVVAQSALQLIRTLPPDRQVKVAKSIKVSLGNVEKVNRVALT